MGKWGSGCIVQRDLFDFYIGMQFGSGSAVQKSIGKLMSNINPDLKHGLPTMKSPTSGRMERCGWIAG